MRLTFIININLAIVLILFTVPIVASESGETLVVTTKADSGPGTLRQALQNAQNGDSITFDQSVFPPNNPATIILKSPLPSLEQGNLIIDASNAGVILDGSSISETESSRQGLSVSSSGNTIHGLQIINFADVGIALGGEASQNLIGGDREIGSGPVGQGNLLGGNGSGIGLWGESVSNNTIQGNYIGTDLSGQNSFANLGNGITIELGAHNNVVGPDNIIAYNGGTGILIGENSVSNTITRNSIHDNGYFGVLLERGGNKQLTPPLIRSFDLQAGNITGWTYPNSVVEVFSDNSNQGAIYEGKVTAGSNGFFTFSKGASFTGPHLTVTTTDTDGNTSNFCWETSNNSNLFALQEGNFMPMTRLQDKTSNQLPDDVRLGMSYYFGWSDLPDMLNYAERINNLAAKRINIGLNEGEPPIDWNNSETEIPEIFDQFIDKMNKYKIAVNYIIHFWDKIGHAEGKVLPNPRFTTQEEIEKFLEYTRLIVSHFKDRVQYYTIWSEPDACGPESIKCIEPLDYINLVKQLIPVIKEIDPKVKIVTGPVVLYFGRDHLYTLINSDAIQLFDVISTHPFYDTAPDIDFIGYSDDESMESIGEYYYLYPSIVTDILQTASAHGFQGQYWGEDFEYRLTENKPYDEQPWPGHTWIQNSKYFFRAIVMHLGMDAGCGMYSPSRHLYTILNSTKPANLSEQIECEATNLVHYGFTHPSWDLLLAYWNDNVAEDFCTGIPATLRLPGVVDKNVSAIDVFYGFEHELVTEVENDTLVIHDLLVMDYPIILSMTSSANSVTRTNQSPYTFALHQNYPNPFNPETTIEYQLPNASFVELKIFNITGQEIKTLISTKKQAGLYSIMWDGTNKNNVKVSSGIYICRVKFRNKQNLFIQERKMVLLK